MILTKDGAVLLSDGAALTIPASQEELDSIADGIGVATPSTPASIEAQVSDLIEDANAATGESDATLTDAVGSLIAGQGGGKHLVLSTGGYLNAEVIESDVNVSLRSYAFENCTSLKTLHLYHGSAQGSATWVGSGCSSIESVIVGHQSGNIPPAFFRALSTLRDVTLGSVGYAVTGISENSFYDNHQSGLTYTIYVADDASLPLSGQPWGATNATFIYRSATTGEVIPVA